MNQKQIRAEAAAKEVANFANEMSMDMQSFVDAIANEHRTIQQAFTGLCFAWIRKAAEQYDKGDFDGRNEYSVEQCEKITKYVDVSSPPFI